MIRINRQSITLGAAIFVGFALSHAQAQISFLGLGPNNSASDISYDGSVIVGGDLNNAFRWTEATGAVPLGTLPNFPRSGAHAVSGNGAVIVGSVFSHTDFRAFRWTQSTGMVDMGLPAETSPSDVSFDGSTVVGTVHYGAPIYSSQAFRWTAGTGMELLGGNYDRSYASAVSADGSRVIGGAHFSELGRDLPVIWPDVTEPPLGVINGSSDIFEVYAEGANSTGTIVVGSANFEHSSEAWLSSASTGTIGLADNPEHPDGSGASAVSDDGSIVIGSRGFDGFIWTPESGMQDLLHVLQVEYGIADQLTGWSRLNPHAITPDGRFIVGNGMFNGQQEGWRLDRGLTVSPVPEPAIFGYGGCLILMAAMMWRKHRSHGDTKASTT